mmetsp:Transcript_12669/g.28450  ORF Transcript_12669/g.28450 Transcript_12669/m.28450 type:complete len:211 (+) Transcript_12669:608-1240(+)
MVQRHRDHKRARNGLVGGDALFPGPTNRRLRRILPLPPPRVRHRRLGLWRGGGRGGRGDGGVCAVPALVCANRVGSVEDAVVQLGGQGPWRCVVLLRGRHCHVPCLCGDWREARALQRCCPPHRRLPPTPDVQDAPRLARRLRRNPPACPRGQVRRMPLGHAAAEGARKRPGSPQVAGGGGRAIGAREGGFHGDAPWRDALLSSPMRLPK